ncbi:MAG: TonB-dependent siderophore receptor [Sphingomonas sp.]|uniref:TonB-dependent siderophore receptor n=1 Tax=Sphingomonas sp. TaxID=28214 RepID=UPI0025FA052F|nr:TonB-dependent siderophore receptor [Sphingomonas sp.]MBX9882880.1 TonB-dependent siderophore receptor [Sphingomonas sp.]
MTLALSARALLLACAAATVAMPAVARIPPSAEPEPAALENDVVITGVRQSYRGEFALSEIPQSIDLIDGKLLEQNNILRLTDALDLNASVARQNTLGGLWDAFAVRGFAGDENLPSGYLVNGFNGGRGFGGQRDSAGLERVEVLKGPAAALFGRGEPGGTINLVTKQAKIGESFGASSFQYGAFDRFRTETDWNLSTGPVALRLIGYAEDAGSFRDFIGSNRWGFLPSVGVKLSDRTRLTYDLELTRMAVPFDRGIVVLNGNFNTVPRSRFLGEPSDGDTVARATGHQLRVEHDFSQDWSVTLGASYRETLLSGASSDAELVGSRQQIFRDGRSLSRQRRTRRYDSNHFTVRGELAGRFETLGLAHRFLLGADHDEFNNDQDFRRFRPPTVASNPSPQAGYVIDVLNPVYGRFPVPTPAPLTNRLDTQRATGVYVQDQITLTDRLQLRLGGRYDSFLLRTNNRITRVISERTADRFSPQIGAVYRFSDTISSYAAYGEGFRANIGTDVNGVIFNPETSTSVEVGAKLALFNGALTGTFALFQMEKANVLASDTANPGFSVAIGRARSRGIELDLAGTLPGKIDVRLSYAYIEAQARSTVLDPNFSFQIRPGDRLINIPDHSLNVQASRRFEFGRTGVLMGGNVQHVGGRSGETGTRFTLPAHTLVRLFATVTLSKQLELFGEVSNLFDEQWYANSYAALWVQPGTPRTGSIGIRARF